MAHVTDTSTKLRLIVGWIQKKETFFKQTVTMGGPAFSPPERQQKIVRSKYTLIQIAKKAHRYNEQLANKKKFQIVPIKEPNNLFCSFSCGPQNIFGLCIPLTFIVSYIPFLSKCAMNFDMEFAIESRTTTQTFSTITHIHIHIHVMNL